MASRAASPALRRRIGERIRALRERTGRTQEDVAWGCGIPKAHLSRIENGMRMPSLPVLFDLAKELGVEAADLLTFGARASSAKRRSRR